MRAHLYRPIQDSLGNVMGNVTVRVLQPGTVTPVADAIYPSDDPAAVALGNPYTATNGVVDIYMDRPQRVRLGLQSGTDPEFFFDNLDVILPVDTPAAQTETNYFQSIVAGPIAVANNVLRPGIRMPKAVIVTGFTVLFEAALAGGATTVVATRHDAAGAATTDTISVTVADLTRRGTTAAAIACGKDDVWKFNVTAAGGAPADMLLALDCD